MPLINLQERKRKRVKTRAVIHAQSIYQDPRWKSLRPDILLHEPLCRDCAEKGETTLAEEVHHIIPFISGSTPDIVERLAFDRENCVPLCIHCHKGRHFVMNKL